jgi:RNA polymerase sigma factor (sigma-70 family)
MSKQRKQETPEPSEPSDDEQRQLVKLAARGNRDALASLLGLHAPALRSLLERYARDCDLTVEDLLQETFTRVVRNVKSLRFTSSRELHGWFARVARNCATDAVRRRKALRRNEGADGHVETSMPARRRDGREITTPSQAAIRHEEEDSGVTQKVGELKLTPRVMRVLERLTPEQRILITELRIKHRPPREVMSELGLEVNSTLTSKLTRAVKRFSDLLNADEAGGTVE